MVVGRYWGALEVLCQSDGKGKGSWGMRALGRVRGWVLLVFGSMKGWTLRTRLRMRRRGVMGEEGVLMGVERSEVRNGREMVDLEGGRDSVSLVGKDGKITSVSVSLR